jgi:hypothetical protein
VLFASPHTCAIRTFVCDQFGGVDAIGSQLLSRSVLVGINRHFAIEGSTWYQRFEKHRRRQRHQGLQGHQAHQGHHSCDLGWSGTLLTPQRTISKRTLAVRLRHPATQAAAETELAQHHDLGQRIRRTRQRTTSRRETSAWSVGIRQRIDLRAIIATSDST